MFGAGFMLLHLFKPRALEYKLQSAQCNNVQKESVQCFPCSLPHCCDCQTIIQPMIALITAVWSQFCGINANVSMLTSLLASENSPIRTEHNWGWWKCLQFHRYLDTTPNTGRIKMMTLWWNKVIAQENAQVSITTRNYQILFNKVTISKVTYQPIWIPWQ